MANTPIQAYDKNGHMIYPKTLSEGTYYKYAEADKEDAAIANVEEALNAVFSRMHTMQQLITGANEIEASLTLDIKYAKSNSYTDHPLATDPGWRETFELPDTTNPYTWKMTTFSWAGVALSPIFEISATAAYPETLFLYTAQSTNISEFTGPGNIQDNNGDWIDETNSNVRWSTKVKGISPSTPSLYMVTRHREANQMWEDIPWGDVALIGNYAFNSITVIKYKVVSSANCPDPNTECNPETGALSSWLDKVDYNTLAQGTNYIYATHAISVNNFFQKAYESKYWSEPSLISIINK